ncbi:MAG: hypothetical protein K2X66_05430 [Cyanobacteria bacterium]|nr:hypothetical protein [Cyanobacteriota bacterium]
MPAIDSLTQPVSLYPRQLSTHTSIQSPPKKQRVPTSPAPALTFLGTTPPHKENLDSENVASPPKKKPKEKRAGFFSTTLSSTVSFFFTWVAMIGAGHVYNEAIGDGRLPQFKVNRSHQETSQNKIYQNTTIHLQGQKNISAEAYWASLQPTLKILKVVSPEIEAWVQDRHQLNKIQYTLPETEEQGAIAAFDPRNKTLHFGEPFWAMADGHKAAAIAHEYRHSRQNIPKMISTRITQMMTGKFLDYPCLVEDEAHLYQQEFYRAIGMSDEEVLPYLKARDLSHLNS